MAALTPSLFAQIWLVSQLYPLLGQSDLATVIHILVTSRLDYYNVLCLRLRKRVVEEGLEAEASAA